VKGRFITIEGIDGAGKSTHIDALASRLRGLGEDVVCTREPGGTPLAEKVRELFLIESMDPLTEALLVFAARRDHIQKVILPALARGCTVLCDRFTDATFAYQGEGRGFDTEILAHLEEWVQADLQPDLTLWLDLPPQVAAQRRSAVRNADRFEQQDIDFFTRVRAGYLARAHAHPERICRIDAEQDRKSVEHQIVLAMKRLR
jgi:dTMP kinase